MTADPLAGITPAEAHRYRQSGWWREEPLGMTVRERAGLAPDTVAYVGESISLTWAEYDRAADDIAARLVGLGLGRGSRVAVYLPDGPLQHVVYTACERAGQVIVGIPERAGDRELAHLLDRAAAALLVCPPRHRGRTGAELVAAVRGLGARIALHAEVTGDGGFAAYDWHGGGPHRVAVSPVSTEGRQLRPDELWLLNATSGTTGSPKCVQQTQNRWLYFVRIATEAAQLDGRDVVMSLVPRPFGFGLWTAHVAPPLLGVRCVLQERFDAAAALRAVEEHRVTVLACVTTQLVRMLGAPELDEVDLSSLRVVYTGGERVPPERARDWERRSGCTVLQFYGSNEIGPFSCTSLADDEDRRLGTVGRVVPGVDYRLYDDAGHDVTATGGPGQPGARGPGACGGYWDDDAANAELRNADGYFLMPDLVTVGGDGYVRVSGRKADLIIRGGKNISAASVETQVGAHPAVDLVAAVAVPDAAFGERVCAVVTLAEPTIRPTLAELTAFLAERGVSKEYFPEYLVVVPEMPQSAGGKIAKTELRRRLPELLGQTE